MTARADDPIQVRFLPEERARLAVIAEQQGQHLSEFVRLAALRAAEAEPTNALHFMVSGLVYDAALQPAAGVPQPYVVRTKGRGRRAEYMLDPANTARIIAVLKEAHADRELPPYTRTMISKTITRLQGLLDR